MNQPEHEFAAGIIRHLDYGVERLDAGTVARLAAARARALDRYGQPARVGPGLLGLRWSNVRQLAAISTIVLALVGIAYWQSTAPVNELAEIDSFLLTDELPPSAYLDKGFDSWLKRSSR
jgi:hypothetical protein